ncbi:integral membrane protein 2C isoform X2 [Cimex lectularius]|uniref:Integral membrane protein 2 n=1 Tax=Cimex lectularius TaxID=79782 RepID=A0A8I6S6K6_CIMLE|nr:integral membrane protein 2C isoform X2 [Cimex lectularius]
MTIVTKPLSEKKNENKEPLVDGFNVDVVSNDSEKGLPVFPRPAVRPPAFVVRKKRVNAATSACLYVTALIVLSCGLITGLHIYSQFGRLMTAQLLSCRIPYSTILHSDEEFAMPLQQIDDKERYFHEDFEIDYSHEKINVPDFSGSRNSKFIHDFSQNKTGIVDVDGKRCFVMPLNHTNVLPPETLYDLIKKMQDGYYEINTAVIRDTMRVVLPAIEDRSSLGIYIRKECQDYAIYRLEKFDSRVYKRSAEPEIKFVAFAGKNTQELHIVNFAELETHEEQVPVAMA